MVEFKEFELTKKEYKAVDKTHSYLTSLDYLDYDEESKQSSDEDELTKTGLAKLLRLHNIIFNKKSLDCKNKEVKDGVQEIVKD